MQALKIEVDFLSGERAGGIVGGRASLPTFPGWQSTAKGLEIRLVRDGDVELYRDVEGVEIIEGETAIDAAVAELNPPVTRYAIVSEALLAYSLQQKKIKVDDLGINLSLEEVLIECLSRGALGIARIEPTAPCKCCELVSMAKRREMERARAVQKPLGDPRDNPGGER